eukprot:scaffold26461_cov101-Isochrysis_galbana.AAC.4
MTIAARINEIARKLKETPSNEIDWPMWEERYTSIGCGARAARPCGTPPGRYDVGHAVHTAASSADRGHIVADATS